MTFRRVSLLAVACILLGVAAAGAAETTAGGAVSLMIGEAP